MAYQGEFKEEIIGNRIVLRKHPLTFDMAKQIFALTEESRDCLRVFLPWPDLIRQPEDSFAFIYQSDKKWKEKETAEYGIFDKETDTLMGGLGIMHFHENDSAEIGYWLATRFQGKGYMREAVQLLENNFFPTLMRIVIRNDVKNLRSANVPAKIGYHLDGVMRSAMKYSDGHYGDLNVWSKLRSDWEKQHT